MSSIGTRDTFCEPSPICCLPGDIFGTSGLAGFSSGETVPNLFWIILGSVGVDGVSSTGVYCSTGVCGLGGFGGIAPYAARAST